MVNNINIANHNTLHNYLEKQLITKRGYCLDSEGKDQNTGTISLPTHSSAGKCLADCQTHLDATGCEYHKGGGECVYHTMDVADGSGDKDAGYYCWIIKSGTNKM